MATQFFRFLAKLIGVCAGIFDVLDIAGTIIGYNPIFSKQQIPVQDIDSAIKSAFIRWIFVTLGSAFLIWLGFIFKRHKRNDNL